MTTADTFVGFAAIASVAALAYGPWQTTCTDIARQYCFAKRDRLFDIALAGRIDFRSSEYRAMRLSLEKTIRFCHEMSVYKLLLFGFDRTTTLDSGHLSTLSRAAARVADPDTREDLQMLACEVEMFLLFSIWLKSPLLWLLTPIFMLLVLSIALFSAARSTTLGFLRALGERVQIQAEGA